MLPRKFDIVHPKDLQFLESYDHLVVDNPHVGDPRNLQHTQWNYCRLRYALFCRCCKELGEGNPRCKYQYYRAEMACTQDFLDIANKYRDNGTHSTDILPSRQTMKDAKITVVKAASLSKDSRGLIKLSLAVQCPIDWCIACGHYQNRLLELLDEILNLGWVSVKADAHWGVNRATRAIENNIDVEAVILFKGNVCNNMIWHIPAACRLKGVPFVSIEKKVTLPHTIPVKNISVLAIKKTNVHMGCLSEAVRYNYDYMTVKYAAY